MLRPFAKSMFMSVICFSALSCAEESKNEAQPCRATVRHIEGGGVGYNNGYTTLEAFLAPDPQLLSVMPFVDLRGHVFDDGKFAGNAGLGIRSLADCRIYGANIYYDYRSAKRQNYNQVGLGFETLGVKWDFRLNGYLPVASKKTSLYDEKVTTTTSFDFFQGNEAFLKQTLIKTGKVQFAMKGLNAEVAFHILKTKNIDLYAAGGPYYYGYSSKQAIGGQARVGVQLYKYVSLEVINSYDNRFHENFQGSIGFNIPFGARPKISKRLEKCKEPCFLSQRLVQDVERQEIIVIDKFRKKNVSTATSVAIDPQTGNPYYFVFVDNTSHSDGTYESPYPTLSLAEVNSTPGNIIYVYPGDGTTKGMDAGITLQDNQSLLGSGTSNSLATTLGNVTIPAQTSTMPTLTNTGSFVVMLASGNTVSGLKLEGINDGTGSLIVGENNITGALITNNVLTASSYTGNGIAFTNNENLGNVVISDCQIILTGSTGHNVSGILFSNNSADFSTTLTDNLITITGGDGSGGTAGSGYGISYSANTGTLLGTLSGNTLSIEGGAGSNSVSSGDSYGISYNANGAIANNLNNNMISSLSGVIISGGTGNSYGLSYANNTGQISGSLSLNSIIMPIYRAYGVIYLNNTQEINTSLISNNITVGDSSYGVYYYNNSGTIASSLTSNNITVKTSGYGIYYYANAATISGSLLSNNVTITGAGNGTGIYYENTLGEISGSLSLNTIVTGINGVCVEYSSNTGKISGSLNSNTLVTGFQGTGVDYVGNSGIISGSLNSNNFLLGDDGTGISYSYNSQLISGTVSANKIQVGVDTGGYTGVLYGTSNNDLAVDITDNVINLHTGAEVCYGIQAMSGALPGTFSIRNNTITLEGSGRNDCYGVHVELDSSTESLCVTALNNTVNTALDPGSTSYGYLNNLGTSDFGLITDVSWTKDPGSPYSYQETCP